MAVDIIARAMGGRGITIDQLQYILQDYVKKDEIIDPEQLEELVREEIEKMGYAILLDTAANWNAQRDLVGKDHTMYVYIDQYSYIKDGQTVLVPGLKIGDGNAYLIDKPFIDEDLRTFIAQHISNNTIHITQTERQTWNNKLNYKEQITGDCLEFTRN